jgi:hypothetical protein
MKRQKTSPDFESLQRRIARRLKAGMPLAGMIAATTLLCGCNEGGAFGRTAGSVPMDRTEQPQPPAKKNGKNEDPEKIPMGYVPSDPNRKSEIESTRTTGAMPPPAPNRKNEKVDPASTRGRYPAKKEDK